MSFESSYGYGDGYEPWAQENPKGRGLPFSHTIEKHLSSEPGIPWITVIGESLYVSFCGVVWPTAALEWQHRMTYCSQMTPGQPGVLGTGWILSDMPFLTREKKSEADQLISAVGRVASVAQFWKDNDGGWTGMPGHSCVLEHDTVDRSFRLKADAGTAWHFHNFEGSMPRQLRGRLKGISLDDGSRLRVLHGINDEITLISTRRANQEDVTVSYEYVPDVFPLLRLKECSLQHNGKIIRRVAYIYSVTGVLEKISWISPIINGWEASAETELEYHKNGRLRKIDLKILNSGELSESGWYKISYGADGAIMWIEHDGTGNPPQYLG